MSLSPRKVKTLTNSFPFPVPTEIGQMESVTELFLGYNNLHSTLPTQLNNLLRLQSLSLLQNDLTGPLPDLGSLSVLETLNVGHNAFTGHIPSTFGLLGSLEHLNLSYNLLSSSIPSQLGSLSSVQKIFLENNLLSGTLPAEIGGLATLEQWNSANNQLSGDVPVEYTLWPRIKTFNVSGNNLSLGANYSAGLCKGNQSTLLVFDCSSYECGCTTDPAIVAAMRRNDSRK